jgi:glutamine synthetase
MDTKGVKTIEDVRTLFAERNPEHVKVGVFDIDGVMRGKYMSRAKFLSALEKGFGFCDVVLGWDLHDQLYDNVTYTGWHTGYPDAPVRILPASVRELPFEDNTLFFLGEFAESAEAVCPRGTLRRVLDRAREWGLTPWPGLNTNFSFLKRMPTRSAKSVITASSRWPPVFLAIRSCATPSTVNFTGN